LSGGQHRFHLSRDLQVSSQQGDVNSLAVVALVMVVGIAAFMWWKGRLRGPAGLVTVAGIVAILIYVAFFASMPPS
jgi:hypothetical protein